MVLQRYTRYFTGRGDGKSGWGGGILVREDYTFEQLSGKNCAKTVFEIQNVLCLLGPLNMINWVDFVVDYIC